MKQYREGLHWQNSRDRDECSSPARWSVAPFRHWHHEVISPTSRHARHVGRGGRLPAEPTRSRDVAVSDGRCETAVAACRWPRESVHGDRSSLARGGKVVVEVKADSHSSHRDEPSAPSLPARCAARYDDASNFVQCRSLRSLLALSEADRRSRDGWLHSAVAGAERRRDRDRTGTPRFAAYL